MLLEFRGIDDVLVLLDDDHQLVKDAADETRVVVRHPRHLPHRGEALVGHASCVAQAFDDVPGTLQIVEHCGQQENEAAKALARLKSRGIEALRIRQFEVGQRGRWGLGHAERASSWVPRGQA